jgi:hypothetical protein
VIGLVVGDHRGAEALDPGGLELAEQVGAGRTAVDQHGRGARRLQQDRVALADVQHHHPQAARRRGWTALVAGEIQSQCRDGDEEEHR